LNVIFVDRWGNVLNVGVLVFFVVGCCSLLIDLLLSFFRRTLCDIVFYLDFPSRISHFIFIDLWVVCVVPSMT
jgi:hypothetical protein